MKTIMRAALCSVSFVGINAALSAVAVAQTVTPPVQPPASNASTDKVATASQTTEAADADIVVTAQRRSERLQDVPVAISAFDQKQLAVTGTVSLEQIAPRVPSFYFGSFGALRPQLYIRGIGTRSFDPGSESSVGVFTDEVYLGRSSGSFGALKDVSRIEVLRGPQGTLYGRNTIAGAINVITNGPTPDFQAHAEAGVSNYGGYELLGAVGGPVNESKTVMFRVAGWRSYRDGYVTNLKTGNKSQGVDNYGGRARLAFRPSDAVSIDLTAEYIKDGNGAAFGGVNQGTGRTAAGAPANPSLVFFAPGSAMPILPVDLTHANLFVDPTLDREAKALIGKVEFDVGFATLTSISAYRHLSVQDGRELEGSSLDVVAQNSDERSKQFTQELRLTSTPGGPASFGGALDWIVGAFYYNDRSRRVDNLHIGVNSVVRAAFGTPATDILYSDYATDSYAVFGQATLHLGPKVELTVGGRYSSDLKKATQSGTTTDNLPFLSAPYTAFNRARFSSFDPRAVLTYKFNRDVNVYASYSTGFKSGGFQYLPFSVAQASVIFKPENIKTYEVGLKSEFLDHMVRANVAAFYYDYKNLQVSRIIDAGGAPVSLITNAAASTIKGVDLDVTLKPTRHIEFSIAYGYLDAKYDNYVFNVAQNLDFSGTTMVRAPKHSINVGAQWQIPVSDNGGVTLRADYSLLSRFYHEPGEGNPIYGSAIPLTVEPGYGLLDLRVGYETRKWRATAYVTNATDVAYRRTVNALGSAVVGYAGQPRIYGAKLSVDF